VFALDQEEVRLGRDLANEITISDPEVSRHHARFSRRDESIFLEDLGSTNGSFLNGERISSPQQLRGGDVITFGENIVMVFEKVSFEQEATVVAAPEPVEYEPSIAEPESLQDVPEVPAFPEPQPSVRVPEEPSPEPAAPQRVRAKKSGLPTWLMILIIAIVVLACVIAVTLYFMPATWWCAITFDMLAGCPIP
jgi:pSer/pThr/pTyr-binding forkhead associated (FHA) protein